MCKSLILVTYIYLYKSLPKIITRSYPRSLSYFTDATKEGINQIAYCLGEFEEQSSEVKKPAGTH